MKPDRLIRVNERVREELAAALYRLTPGSAEADPARVSFVSARVAPDLHNAVVTVSVLGDDATARKALSWLRAHRAEFQRRLAERVGLKYTPVLDFRLTGAIAGGDRVLAILDELGAPDGPPPPADAAP